MKKIPCLFVRNFRSQFMFTLTPEVTLGCEWVLSGEGTASRKWDGTACMARGGFLFARYDAKAGKTPPVGAIPCEPSPDSVPGHWPHWVPVAAAPQYCWHRAAWQIRNRDDGFTGAPLYEFHGATPAERLGFSDADGTYGLIGPKVGGNHERQAQHVLKRHGDTVFTPVRTFGALHEFLRVTAIEGLVFAHPDGRMAKIRRHDFGFDWPVE